MSAIRVDQMALAGLVTLGVLSIIRGWLVPISVHESRIADKDAQIERLTSERDEWRAAFHASEEARAVIKEQNGALIRSAETTTHLLESLREATGVGAPKG